MSPLSQQLPGRSGGWCRGVIMATTILCAVAVPPLGGSQGHPPLTDYVIVGEALSSPRPVDPITFSYRMFSVPDLEPLCRRAADIVRLRSEISRLRLHVGEPFRPGSLRIVALDASGTVLPKIPLMIDVNGPQNVFARDNLQGVPDGSITPTTSTSVRFRIRTMCPGPGADTFVRADISRE
jgi:hypothetical protein